MQIPEELKYTKTHEWIKVDANVATVGITDYAQSELADIVHVELPEIGRKVSKGDACGTIEAVKTVADLYSPLSGEVIEVNEKVKEAPEIINRDPYGEGWMFKLKIEKKEEIDKLLKPEDYKKLIEGHFYRCTICGRIYRRGKSKYPWPACGHPVSAQQEISKEEYMQYKIQKKQRR